MSNLRVDGLESLSTPASIKVEDIVSVLDYVEGVVVSSSNQLLTDSKGSVWKVSKGADLPFILDTATSETSGYIYKVQSVLALGDLKGLTNLQTAVHGDTVEVGSYLPSGVNGGGTFVYDNTVPPSAHNGGTVIGKTKVFPSNLDRVALEEWFTPDSGAGLGAWLRVGTHRSSIYDFGYSPSLDDPEIVRLLLQQLLKVGGHIVVEETLVSYGDLAITRNGTHIEIIKTGSLEVINGHITARNVDNFTFTIDGTLKSTGLEVSEEAIWIPNYHPNYNCPERAFIEFGGVSGNHAKGFVVQGSGKIIGPFEGDAPVKWQETYAINKKGVACWFASDITFRDFTISRFEGECVYVWSAKPDQDTTPVSNVLFENLTVVDVGFNALNFNAASRLINATMRNCTTQGFNYQAVEASAGTIQGCHLAGSTGPVVQVGGLYAFDVVVENCYIDCSTTSTSNYAAIAAVGSVHSLASYNFSLINCKVVGHINKAINISRNNRAVVTGNTFIEHSDSEKNDVIASVGGRSVVSSNIFITLPNRLTPPISINTAGVAKGNYFLGNSGNLIQLDEILSANSKSTSTKYSAVYARQDGVGFEHVYVDSLLNTDVSALPVHQKYGSVKFTPYASGLGRYELIFNRNNYAGNAPTPNLVADASGGVYPGNSGTQTLGKPLNKWSTLYSVDIGEDATRISTGYFTNITSTNAVSVTSDARTKVFYDITSAEREVAKELKDLIFKYKKKAETSPDTKVGPMDTRFHFGTSAQEVVHAFEKHGLRSEDYALLDHVEWEDEFVTSPDGEVVLTRSAGDRYAIKYSELICFILCAL